MNWATSWATSGVMSRKARTSPLPSGRTNRRRSGVAVLGVLLAALLGTACGTLGHDPQPAAPGDGVSGFRFESLVELCVGTVPVSGSPTPYGQLSACVVEDIEAKACESTSDCDNFTEECRCGRCVVRVCERNSGQCGEGSICSGGRCTPGCSVDAECGDGLKCAGGGCATPCDSSAPCAYGERCDVTGACRTASCSGGGGCGRGQHCEVFQETAAIREPAALSESDFRYVQMSEPGQLPAIFRAHEVSAKIWVAKPEEPVLELAAGASAPFVRSEDGGVALYVGSSDGVSIYRAWSADGAAFGEPLVVLSAETEGWEKGWIGSPSVIDFEGKRLLFYEAGRGAGIGIAELDGLDGGDRGVAERLHERAAIDPTRVEDPLFWRSIQSVSTPHAVVVNDAVRIYFTALGAEGNAAVEGDALLPAAINDSIGMLTTRDFVNYESFPTGPIYARRASLRAYLGEREPHLLFSDDGVRLYFRATTAGGVDSGLAVAVGE